MRDQCGNRILEKYRKACFKILNIRRGHVDHAQGHLKHAYSNQVESISYTLPALAGGAIMDIDHAGARTAALIIVLGRAIFGPLYYSGVTY